jgi:KTSC domain
MPLKYDDPAIQLFDVPTPEGVIPVVARMIESSNIKWVGWPEKQMKKATPLMFVEFTDGSRYVYFGVTRQRAAAAAYAESTGSYLAKKVKGKYEYLKLR